MGFDIVNFPFIDGGISRVLISQLIRFARVSSQVVDFNTRNKILIPKLLKEGYRYHTQTLSNLFKILQTPLRPIIKIKYGSQITS